MYELDAGHMKSRSGLRDSLGKQSWLKLHLRTGLDRFATLRYVLQNFGSSPRFRFIVEGHRHFGFRWQHLIKLVLRADGDDFAVIDDRDPIAKLFHFLHVVGRVNKREPLALEAF